MAGYFPAVPHTAIRNDFCRNGFGRPPACGSKDPPDAQTGRRYGLDVFPNSRHG